MVKHRDLNLSRLVAGVPPDSLRAFLALYGLDPPFWASVNGDVLRAWLSEPDQVEREATVLEHLRRVNDLGLQSSGALIAACNKHGISPRPKESLEALALRLFVDAHQAFDYAWSRFLLYTNVEYLTEYHFPAGPLGMETEMRTAFHDGVREHFAKEYRGRQCRVDPHEDNGELVVVVQRGHYQRTVGLFSKADSDEIDYLNFQPVVDDLLMYDPAAQILRIKTTTKSDREMYLWLFAHHVAGRDDLVRPALDERVYTLEPIQNGTFNYAGAGDVLGVRLVRARIQFGPKAYDDIHAEDVLKALANRSMGLSLSSGPLLRAALVFDFRVGLKSQPVRFEIAPPSRGWVRDRRFEGPIHDYLKAQGVKLL
jgi:hypothetical protein